MKFKHIIYFTLSMMFLYPTISIAQLDPLTDPLILTLNAINCKIKPDSDLSVCVLNKTGEDLNSNEINLGQAVKSVDGDYSSASTISYETLQNNHFLILESTFSRIKEGDIRNQVPYAHVYYLLRTKWG